MPIVWAIADGYRRLPVRHGLLRTVGVIGNGVPAAIRHPVNGAAGAFDELDY
jgi:hypothetical protein